jgi:alpha-beta hydrolase superfamily lysophospholipase
MASRPLHLTGDDAAVFAIHDAPPAGTEPGAPVLICSPWGWDDVASYRARRGWARRLAAAGHHTLRLDLPATGNSDGRPGDEGVVDAWVMAIIAAAGWLAAAAGAASVVAVGLGLGGLLGLQAAGEGAPIAAMALWGVPGSGRRFVRETRAFAGLQSWTADPDFDPGVAEGWIEAAGFGLAPPTIEALSKLAPGERVGVLRSVLAFERDGIPTDPKLLARLGAAGVAVESAPGAGWGDFVSHPERAELADAVATRFESWLDGLDLPTPTAVPEEPAPDPVPASLRAWNARETAVTLPAPWGDTVGVLAEPEGGGGGDLCAVFLNAGAVRGVGPSRLWTETARDWAAAGVPSLRVDLEGIGEADGEPSGELGVGDFYAPRYIGQVRGVLDECERRGWGRRFLLVGLCAGGYWAFQTAVADERVVGAFAINAGALRWHPNLLTLRAARLGGGRAREGAYWRKLLHGEVERGKVAAMLRSMVRRAVLGAGAAFARPFGRSQSQRLVAGIEADLDRLGADGKRVLLAFSAKEPLGEEVEADGLERRHRPGIDFATLPGSDHTLRPPVAQRAFHELVDAELSRLRGGVEARA